MANVQLAELTEEQKKMVQATINPAFHPEDIPDWARALANSSVAFDRFLDERHELYQYFGAEEHAMIQFAAASLLETSAPCKAIGLAKLRNLGWSDEKIVNFSMLAATVRRNAILTAGLGITDPHRGPEAYVELIEVADEKVRTELGGEPPAWAKALAHQPRILQRLVAERDSDLGFNSEQWTMVQYAHAILFSVLRNCAVSIFPKLRDFGWVDAKIVEFAAMVSNIHRNSVLLSALGV